MMVSGFRLRTVVAVAATVIVASGCSNDSSTVSSESLRQVEECVLGEGFTLEDPLGRATSEPAFARMLDRCTTDAGITTEQVLDIQRDVEVANTRHVKAVAKCMGDRGRPMEVEVLKNGSANFGELSRYFTPETLDEFFDDFAECNGTPRESFLTEASVEADRRAAQTG